MLTMGTFTFTYLKRPININVEYFSRTYDSELVSTYGALQMLLAYLLTLPEDVTSSQSEYTFRRQLKTWLFKKSFPDIII